MTASENQHGQLRWRKPLMDGAVYRGKNPTSCIGILYELGKDTCWIATQLRHVVHLEFEADTVQITPQLRDNENLVAPKLVPVPQRQPGHDVGACRSLLRGGGNNPRSTPLRCGDHGFVPQHGDCRAQCL